MSESELEENIDQFLTYFKSQIENVKKIEATESEKLFKKIIYMTMIDTLARTSYIGQNNKERFISFIDKFSGWTDCQKLSLPQLVYFLRNRAENSEFNDAYNLSSDLLSNWNHGKLITLDNDPQYSGFTELWPANPKGCDKLENLMHRNLFYSYRNCLIHEFRKLGYGVEFQEDSEPYYHSLDDIDNGTSWELVYPVGFFESILEHSIESLRVFYLENGICPRTNFNYGSQWIE